jgi:hypothetical protein
MQNKGITRFGGGGGGGKVIAFLTLPNTRHGEPALVLVPSPFVLGLLPAILNPNNVRFET